MMHNFKKADYPKMKTHIKKQLETMFKRFESWEAVAMTAGSGDDC